MPDLWGPTGEVRTAEDIPAEQCKYIPIISPKPGANVHAICLGKRFCPVATHFLNNRTKPCIYPERECEGCRAMLVRRWKAYNQGWIPGVSRLVILEVTKDAVEHNRALTKPSRSLRGARVIISRLGSARNGPVRAELDFRHPNTGIPEAFELGEALCRVWGMLPAVARMLGLDREEGAA